VTVTAFDTLAQQVNEHVKKGDQILVSGRLRDECVLWCPNALLPTPAA
jgi:single-stranded DNA-binding protein